MSIYPLVMTNIAMENHQFSLENPLFQWQFSIANYVCLPEGRCHMVIHSMVDPEINLQQPPIQPYSSPICSIKKNVQQLLESAHHPRTIQVFRCFFFPQAACAASRHCGSTLWKPHVLFKNSINFSAPRCRASRSREKFERISRGFECGLPFTNS